MNMYFRISILLLFTSLFAIFPCDKFKLYNLPPKDDSSKDKSFSEFKNKLNEAIRKKDKKFLLEAVDQEIHFSFGEENGKKSFIRYYELDQKPKESGIWVLLERTLKLGSNFKEGKFVFPYFFETMPSDVDPFTSYLVIGTNVNVRSEPKLDAPSITKLSYQLVSIGEHASDLEEDPKSDKCLWQKVCMADGRTGYICDHYLRSSLDYRAFFEKKKNQWKMTVFIAGD